MFLCRVQILLGHQTFSSITPRLAELGVRLMLTESEAAAGAARAGSHHRGHHFTTAGGRTHSQRSQSMLQKAADGAAALFGSGRRKLGSPLPHEDDMDESHHGELRCRATAQCILGSANSTPVLVEA